MPQGWEEILLLLIKILRACLDTKCNNTIKYCPDIAVFRPGTHFCNMRSKDKEIAFLKYLNEVFFK